LTRALNTTTCAPKVFQLRGEKSSDSPFVVLAVEEAIEYVAERADMMEVIQNNHSGELYVCVLRVTLLCQGGQVLPQVLCKEAVLALNV